jgi:hypothetical protein
METRLTSGTLKLMAISFEMRGRPGACRLQLEGSAAEGLLVAEVLGLLVEVAAGGDEIGDGEWQGRR